MKLSQATDQDKIRAVAELRNQTWKSNTHTLIPLCQHCGKVLINHIGQLYCPMDENELHSYDAILPVVQKQWKENENFSGLDFHAALLEVRKHDEPCHCGQHYTIWAFRATPSEIANALLIATGKFEL